MMVFCLGSVLPGLSLRERYRMDADEHLAIMQDGSIRAQDDVRMFGQSFLADPVLLCKFHSLAGASGIVDQVRDVGPSHMTRIATMQTTACLVMPVYRFAACHVEPPGGAGAVATQCLHGKKRSPWRINCMYREHCA